jgi:polyketide synthase PksL
VAAVSSFGAGGANAHIVLEEYIADFEPMLAGGEKEVFMFSARSHQQLSRMTQNFIAYLDREMINSPEGISQYITRNKSTPMDVAMTLAQGRRHFRNRLAVLAADFTQLRSALSRFLATCGKDDPKSHTDALETQEIFYGDIEEQGHPSISNPMQLSPHGSDAQAWVLGAHQSKANVVSKWHRVPLPGYEFLRNRYWVEDQVKEVEQPKVLEQANAINQMPALKNEHTVIILTPSLIMDRVAQGVMSREEARNHLLAMSRRGSQYNKGQLIR